MAYVRCPPHHQDSSSPRKRRSPLSRRLNHTGEPCLPPDTRQVLEPLHPNLRRLPSRLIAHHLPTDKNFHMARHVVQVGIKRKRIASANENMSCSTRAGTRSKRLRSETLPSTRRLRYATTSEQDEQENLEECQVDSPQDRSEMDVDDSVNSTSSDGNSEEEEDAQESLSDAGDEDNSDEHLLTSATPNQLSRLRKHALIRLYGLTGLSDDAELMTKSDIISAIIAARDDFAELPPSSPPGQADGNSSEYSSGDGDIAEDEQTDVGPDVNGSAPNLRRRATIGDVAKAQGRPFKGRSASMGHLFSRETNGSLGKQKTSRRPLDVQERHVLSKHKKLNRRSPSTSTTTSISSPVTTRLRSKNRTGSLNVSMSTLRKNNFDGKGKTRPVESSEGAKSLSKRTRAKQLMGGRENERARSKEDESDLTDLEELEASFQAENPRRLRSKSRCIQADEFWATQPRRLPTRKVKEKTKGLKEEDEGLDVREEDELSDEGINEDVIEEEEVDELISSSTPTPPPSRGRRTPLRTRLRPRRRPVPQSSDGDDEGGNVEDADEEAEEGDVESMEGSEDGSGVDEETIAMEPRKLRNGKIVVDVHMEEDIEEEVEEDIEEEVEEAEQEGEEAELEGEEEGTEDGADGGDEEEEDQSDECTEVGDVDIDANEETDEDEMMEENDVDLTVATAKTLVRLRRDDLVRLCETRDLEPVGTKPQLAEALLLWRDRHNNGFSSPSSSGTVRPSSNSRRRRNGTRSSKGSPSAVSSSVHMHMHEDNPATPVPTFIQREKEKDDADLELDLESLGLEDREIPPDKLQKLEKIGSGGFKDVYIGKFKGRKIAISEFRGQLSAMDIKELKLLGGFDHPNIVRFLGVSIPENTKETPVMIVSELCSNGDLFDYIRNVPPASLHKVLAMMLDIARGLEYLHLRKPSVIHRDCKSSNILITAKGTAKIADFGLAKVKQSTRSMVRSLVGTVNWQAPELWHAHPKYNHKVDVFSCAMVFWEVLQWHSPNKKFPWEGMNEHAIYEIVGAKRQRPSLSGLRKHWCTEIVDLVERMWAQDHQDRPTMSEVVEALEEMAVGAH